MEKKKKEQIFWSTLDLNRVTISRTGLLIKKTIGLAQWSSIKRWRWWRLWQHDDELQVHADWLVIFLKAHSKLQTMQANSSFCLLSKSPVTSYRISCHQICTPLVFCRAMDEYVSKVTSRLVGWLKSAGMSSTTAAMKVKVQNFQL